MSCVVAECGVIPGNHGTTLNTCPHLDLDLDQSGAWLIRINDKAQGQNISGVNKHEFNAATRQARPCHLVVSAIEHQSVLAAARASTERGHQLDIAPVDQNGLIDIDAPSHLLRPDTALVSIMLANNETGVIQPIGQLAEMIRLRTPSTWIHTDATQAVGKIPINLDDDLRKVDLVCLSAYKFHGPKGIGALFIRDGLTPGPLIHEEQEDGLRGGTLNSAAAAGLAVASDIAANRIANMEHVALLQDGYEDRLIAKERLKILPLSA